eukprot:scaffold193_cov255-Pinguiococcus_pyrenoidosus.AAC.7
MLREARRWHPVLPCWYLLEIGGRTHRKSFWALPHPFRPCVPRRSGSRPLLRAIGAGHPKEAGQRGFGLLLLHDHGVLAAVLPDSEGAACHVRDPHGLRKRTCGPGAQVPELQFLLDGCVLGVLGGRAEGRRTCLLQASTAERSAAESKADGNYYLAGKTTDDTDFSISSLSSTTKVYRINIYPDKVVDIVRMCANEERIDMAWQGEIDLKALQTSYDDYEIGTWYTSVQCVDDD